MSQYKTDAQWARAFDLPLSVFLGKAELNPIINWTSIPCGLDDSIEDKLKAQRQVISLRKAWGEDSEDLDFGDYIRKYWVE